MIQNKNIKLILNYSCGPLVFGILLFSIYTQLQQQSDWHNSLSRLHSVLNSEALIRVLIVCCLMILNWGIEAMKWREAMKLISPVTIPNGLKAIFSGNALAFFTPNRTGEYLGRMMYVKKEERVSSIPLTILCSVAQLIVTLFAGLAGSLYMKDKIVGYFGSDVAPWLNAGTYVVLAAAIVLTIFYFRVQFIVNWLASRRWAQKGSRHLAVLEHVNATILTSIVSLSIARYVVFMIQYYLLFTVFGIDINWWQAFWAVSVVFLVIAVIPSLGFLSELGIRWQAGIQVVQLFSSNITGIFATSLSIWIINLVIPALIGGFMLLALKLFRKQKI